MENKSIYYELYWKNGTIADYQKAGGTYRTIRGVIRTIRATCNHSVGSDFKVYELTNGNRVEINYHTYLN